MARRFLVVALMFGAGLLALLAVGPDNPYLRIAQANRRFSRGDYTLATAGYLAALAHPRFIAVARYDQGNVYVALGEVAPGRAALHEAAAAPGAPAQVVHRAAFNLGNLSYVDGDYQAAATYYVEALQHTPGDKDAKINLELTLLKLASTRSLNAASPPGASALSESDQRILNYLGDTEVPAWYSNQNAITDEPGFRW